MCLIVQSLRSIVFYGREGNQPHQLLPVFQQRGIVTALEQLYAQEGDAGEAAKYVLDSLNYQE